MDREPTDDQLRAAWRALVPREQWHEFDEARRHAGLWTRVRLRARLVANGVRFDAAPAVHTPAPAPPHPQAAPARHPLHVPSTPPFLDRKSLAAGEREDD